MIDHHCRCCLSGVAGVDGGAYAGGSIYYRPALSRLSVCLVFAETTKEKLFFVHLNGN